MSEFDIYQFEDRVSELLAGYRRLAQENERLRQDYDALSRRHAELERRLAGVITRIKALEAEAEAQQA